MGSYTKDFTGAKEAFDEVSTTDEAGLGTISYDTVNKILYVYCRNTSGGALTVGEAVNFVSGATDYNVEAAGVGNNAIGVVQVASVANNEYFWAAKEGLMTVIAGTGGLSAQDDLEIEAGGAFITAAATDGQVGNAPVAISAGQTGTAFVRL